MLYEVVREELETFLAEAREDGKGLPRYVEKEFREYLKCGQLDHGFARCACEDCGDELLVAFSCKGKGFCPSCLGRRMSDVAAHLVDRVLPKVPYRQWVMAYPRRMRLLLARDAVAARESATIVVKEIAKWQRALARRDGVSKPQTAAVSVTQRFGSKVDLNVHHHLVVPEGVFREDEEGKVGFTELRRPTRDELQAMVERIAGKTMALARRRGLLEEEPDDALSKVQADAVQTGLPVAVPPPMAKKLSGFIEGYSLEAGTHVAASNREALEHLLRYMLRPPVPQHRLRRLADGRLELTLKRPMHDGTRAIAFTPAQLMRRLASIVPPPKAHGTRYFGAFAPASKVRARLVKPGKGRGKGCLGDPPELPAELDDGGAEDARISWELGRELERDVWLEGPADPERPRFLAWPQLLARTFAVDVLRCDKCGGRRRLTAFIAASKEASELLDQLGIKERAPPPEPARRRHRQVEWVEPPSEDPGIDPPSPE